MLKVLSHSWPLLMGIMLLMVGNGIQGTLLGIRGNLEGFTTYQLSYVMAAYFLGFLFGSWAAPKMIRQVGHVRVFAALGSLISAILVIYPVYPDWIVWTALRVLAGFCFSGIYITAESWINNTASNETRGQALSAYMIVQMIGIIASQVLLNLPDPTGFALFILPSVLVSLAFMPILLAPTPAPEFDSTRRVSFGRLFRISPLGCVGMLLTGGVFSAMFGMASVWGAQEGLTLGQISIFVGAIYVGGLVLQYPIGWASDRMDRRTLITGLSAIAAVAMLAAAVLPMSFPALVAIAVILGGITNPVYALLIAYTNDFLPRDQMAGASAGLIFLNGFGAIFGPTSTGWMMEQVGPPGFFLFIGLLYAALAAYALFRMTRRAAPSVSGAFRGVTLGTSPLAVEAVLDDAAKDDPPRKDAA
ncbi:MAG: MFS transporter [Tabrizicola sp.]|uniref:MFS transporter n=1 Tax=Tabrizicola sp. TaxID=2005166 RepID=UPI002AB93DA4|nr:MFS transporter [Tabrizicola sp.]MDZ4085757.1 MFS transporter [Tabrizicola sp.]